MMSESKSTAKYIANKYNFRSIKAYRSAAFGQGNGTIMLNYLNCNGKENDISECPSSGWGANNCGHSQDASVSCSEYIAYIT